MAKNLNGNSLEIKMRKWIMAFAFSLAACASALAAGNGLKPADKATLQAAMFQHIDNQLVYRVLITARFQAFSTSLDATVESAFSR